MSHHSVHHTHFPIFRHLWKPAALTGAGGAAVAIWLDEIMRFGEDILALIFLPIMAGVIYLFDILIFKACVPRREDIAKPDAQQKKG